MRKALKVGELSQYIATVLAQDRLLHRVDVEGEVVNFRKGKYAYFDLRDDRATLHCVVFDPIPLPVKEGDQVVASGRINVYQRGGTYQLIVHKLEPAGLGQKLLALMRLKEKLFQEGLFDPSRKLPFPSYPSRVGLITSLQGAVLHDFANETQHRYGLVTIIACHARVQGKGAADTIRQALHALESLSGDQALDAIVIARGGGGKEDLDCFNDEQLVRAVAQSKVPILSAIGHQVDDSLMDLAADKRASTPTEAAVLLFPDKLSLHQDLDEWLGSLREEVLDRLIRYRNQVHQLERQIGQASPLAQVYQSQFKIHQLFQEVHQLEVSFLKKKREGLEEVQRSIHQSVDRVLARKRQDLYALDQSINQVVQEFALALPWQVVDEEGRLVEDDSRLTVGGTYRLESAHYSYGIRVLDKEEKLD